MKNIDKYKASQLKINLKHKLFCKITIMVTSILNRFNGMMVEESIKNNIKVIWLRPVCEQRPYLVLKRHVSAKNMCYFSEKSCFFLHVTLPPLREPLEICSSGSQQVLKVLIRQVVLETQGNNGVRLTSAGHTEVLQDTQVKYKYTFHGIIILQTTWLCVSLWLLFSYHCPTITIVSL